ncbi:MAG: 50S ribosomal protein L10 [Anaerovoracaceae bacterium]
MTDVNKAAYQEKQVVIDEIKGKLENAQSAVVVDYIGITVEEANNMRKKLRDENVDYTVYKNTLVKRAIEGTEYEELGQILSGPSAFAISDDDATAPARVLSQVIKDLKKMELKGGVIEGTYYDSAGLARIATIPSRDVLIAKFMGSIQSPVGKLVRTFAAIADAKAEGGQEAPAESETPAETAPETKAEEAKVEEKPATEEKPAAETEDKEQ